MTQKKISEISYLKGVGPKRAEAFEKLGIYKISDLFSVYPRDYLINTKINKLSLLQNANVLICGEIAEKALPRKSNHPTRLLIKDDSGYIQCLVWGNAIYREKQFKIGDKYLFWGKVTYNQFEGGVQFELRDHKKFEFNDDEMLKYPLIPIYILSGELKKTWVKPLTLTKIVFNALKKSSSSITEFLSDEIKNENDLLDHKKANPM